MLVGAFALLVGDVHYGAASTRQGRCERALRTSSMRAMRKNILITGASSGLGEGMAREFAKRGRNLALCARRLDRLEELKTTLLAAHPGIRVVVRPLDVTDYDKVFEVFRAFKEDLGTLDRIIVNAGIGKGQPVARATSARTGRRRRPTSSRVWRSAKRRWRSSASRTPGTWSPSRR